MPRWFPEPRCRTPDRQPTPSGPTTSHYDGDKRRRTKTETDDDEDTHSGDERSGSSLTADDTPEWRRLNDVSSSSFQAVLCALSTYFPCSVKAQHIWLAHHIKQTVNTVLVGQSFTTFRVTASHSQACKADSSWIVEHEIHDERVFVTTVGWTVARLSAIPVNLHRPLIVTHTLETVGN